MAPPKSTAWGKTTEHDPQVTPWNEEEEYAPTPPKPSRGRSFRDWAVLFGAVFLLVYVISFLLVGFSGNDSSSPRSGGGFSFGQGKIALIPIHGEIASSTSSDSVGYPDVVAALEDAENDPSVSGVFLDVDSGGGSVVSTKQIVAKIRTMDKPVITWMGELGASGAYYIAASSDYILADSDTITGSIGVISQFPNVTGLLDKLGVSMESIQSGSLKNNGSPYDTFSDDEKEVFQTLIDQAFDGFVSDVKLFRGDKLDQEKFLVALDGRILSGKQALETGLIDELSTREQALEKAAVLSGIQGKPSVELFLVYEPSLRELLLGAGLELGKGFASGINSQSSSVSVTQAK